MVRDNNPLNLKRHSLDSLAEESRRALNDPAFTRGLAVLEQTIVEAIANGDSDGSDAFEANEREQCRMLRTIRLIKQRIMSAPNSQQLRDAGYASSAPPKEE